MNPIIRVANISKVYPLYDRPTDRVKEALHPFRKKYHRDFFALRDISMSVGKGECVGLIGMNGSGKSTLLQVIAGVVTPTAGHCTVQGRISALLELGAGFNPEYSGIENARFQCSLNGFANAEIPKILEEIQAFADIGDFVYQPVKTYSSGMYVRLAFATAISLDPDILIVDEALAVGDIYFQTKCLSKIREFREQGKTLFFVSHDAAAVKSLCDRAFLLHHGQLIDEGMPDDVFNHYNNLISVKADGIKPQSVEEMRKRYGTGRVEIQSVRLRNETGLITDTVTTGEKVNLEIKFKANETVQSPTIGFSIRDRMGIEMYGINNFKLDIDFGAVNAGETYIVRYAIDLRLGHNTYTVSVAAHPEDNHVVECFDWLNDACVFRVVPSPKFPFVGSCLLDTSVSCERAALH